MSESMRSWQPNSVDLPEYLRNMKSLVLAVIDDRGQLIDANRGFLHAIGEDGDRTGLDVSPFLFTPTLSSLLNRMSSPEDPRGHRGPLHQGLITLGRREHTGATVTGEVHQVDGKLLLIAEHDIEDLSRLSEEMIAITASMAEKQRDLVRTKKELERREAELSQLAITDPLTGLYNRRHLTQRLDEEIERSKRMGTPLSVVITDIDRFKQFNDTWGHLCGDRCLEGIAQILNANSRRYDTVARFGGEEFVLVLPGSDVPAAVERAEDLRETIAAAPIPDVDDKVTASFGVAKYTGGTAEELLGEADAALYRAKNAGRNRVEVAGESDEPRTPTGNARMR